MVAIGDVFQKQWERELKVWKTLYGSTSSLHPDNPNLKTYRELLLGQITQASQEFFLGWNFSFELMEHSFWLLFEKSGGSHTYTFNAEYYFIDLAKGDKEGYLSVSIDRETKVLFHDIEVRSLVDKVSELLHKAELGQSLC